MLRRCWVSVFALVCAARLHAQDNYEIQVYGSDTVAKGTTMVEFAQQLHAERLAAG